MIFARKLRELALSFGVEINRYNPLQSRQARMCRLLQTHRIDTVLDVGGNDGGYARELREGGYRGSIISFEPLEAAHRSLMHVASSDPFWYVAPRMALGAAEGEAEINVAGNSTSSSILPMHDLHATVAPQSRYIGVERVPVRRLGTIKHPAIVNGQQLFLKVDTQGYELPVLLGVGELWPKVQGVQLELSLVPLYEGQALYRDLIDWLGRKGFTLWNVIPGFTDPASGRMLQMDGMFFRDL